MDTDLIAGSSNFPWGEMPSSAASSRIGFEGPSPSRCPVSVVDAAFDPVFGRAGADALVGAVDVVVAAPDKPGPLGRLISSSTFIVSLFWSFQTLRGSGFGAASVPLNVVGKIKASSRRARRSQFNHTIPSNDT